MAPDELQLYRQATSDVAAFDLASFGKLVVRGKDAGSFLQNFTTNDVINPGPGSGCETFVLSAQAKVVAWARVMLGRDEVYLNTDPGLVPALKQHLEKHQIAEDVQFEDHTETDCLWHVCGPRLEPRLASLGVALVSLEPWHHASVSLSGHSCRVQRADFVGLPGVFITGAVHAATELEDWFNSQDVSCGAISNPVWTMLRVEAGTPMGGVDFDETNLPQEINRTESAISFTKGCYLGQETVARIRAYGHVNRQLTPVKFPGKSGLDASEWAAWQGAVLKHSEKEIGRVKTVAFSPRLGYWLAFALIRREHLEVGRILTAVHARGDLSQVEVTTWPLVSAGLVSA